jgi:signal transduction histidine kinase
MLEVCKTIALQLQLLGVKEIRNVQTAIFYPDRGTYMNYEFYAKHDKTFVTETVYTNHEVATAFAEQMFKGKGEVYITHIKDNEVKDWLAYQKSTNVFIDTFLENATSLSYYWHSLGPVALGISTYIPLSDEALQLFQRFLKVFDLSYRRYLDIEKAIAQAREAQIEACLERVRSRSMAMHNTSELQEVINTVHKELLHLNIAIHGGSFITINSDITTTLRCWGSGGTADTSAEVQLPPYEKPFCSNLINGIKNGPGFFTEAYTQEEKKDFFTFLFQHEPWSKLDAEQKKETLLSPGGYTRSCCVSQHTSIFIINHFGEKFSAADNDILKRFGKVFEQTYTRFLDLQKAEAQSKEAQVELALERVRAKTMAMQKSDELREVVATMYEQLQLLDINYGACTIVIMDAATGNMQHWVGGFAQKLYPESYQVNYFNHPFIDAQLAQWKNGEKYAVIKLSGENKKAYDAVMFSQTDFKKFPEETKQWMAALDPVVFSIAYMSHGALTWGPEELTEEYASILQRFAKVFEQTYTRFLDLQKAEAQAKEAQIETALERVRARTMGMQKSDELKEVIQVVYDQFVYLNINTEHTGFVMDYKATDDRNIWVADKHGVNSQVSIPYFDSIYYNQFNEAKRTGLDFFATNLSFEEKNNFYQKLFTYIPQLSDEAKEFYFSCPGLAISTVLLENVGLYMENFWGTPFTEEENATLMRFGKVFQQTYTRFLDLQKAEAQAKEAQIEAALEKVRSRTMAMQSSNELQETAVVLFNEFKKLGTDNVYQVTIGIYNEAEGLVDFRVTSWAGSGEQESRSFNLDMNEPTVLQPSVAAWKANKKSLVVDLTGEALEGWINYRNKMSGVTISSKDTEGRRVISIAYFSKGHISISSPLPVPQETIKTLERFAAVFDGTYTRFLDLEKAEAQAKEAQIEAALERVRSCTLAMQKSDELAETAAEVFRQLISLGIAPNRLYIGIVKEETGDMEMWATDEDGTHVGKKFMFNKNENISVKKLFDGWKAKEKSVIVDMEGKELEDYFDYLNNVMHIPFKGGLTQKRRVQSVAYFSKGFIGMASPDGQGDETIQLLERFAAVFNLTFTRFNDLKIAEAHAHQAELDLIAIKEAKQKAEAALTELQATQKQLIQSEKMASLGELTAGIAHEIQNPLNFVNNFSELSNELMDEMNAEIEKGDLEEAKLIANDIKQNLEKINHHGKRADAIVKGMLQHSRSTSATKELTDINKLADEYLRLAYHGLRAKDKSFNATLKTDFDDSIGNINIIPQDMGRVILNLITNAFYVVDEKKKQVASQGLPTFERLATLYEPTVSVSTKKDGNNVLISVKDNGNGIPQKILDKIFQPFFTTKPTGQGTGLGLSLSYDIVKAHGGELIVETKEGEGTTFIISIPMRMDNGFTN